MVEETANMILFYKRVCVYEEISITDLFFLVRFKAAFSEGKIRLGFQKYRRILIY